MSDQAMCALGRDLAFMGFFVSIAGSVVAGMAIANARKLVAAWHALQHDPEKGGHGCQCSACRDWR